MASSEAFLINGNVSISERFFGVCAFLCLLFFLSYFSVVEGKQVPPGGTSWGTPKQKYVFVRMCFCFLFFTQGPSG